MGVKPFYKCSRTTASTGRTWRRSTSDRGLGVRAPVVFYNRCNEAGALLKPGDFDWKTIFASGVRWFHRGGIFAALSETTGELVIEGMPRRPRLPGRWSLRPELSRKAVEHRRRR